MDVPFFGTNLRFYRRLYGFSQHQLAERAGPTFSQSIISRLERGLAPSAPSQIENLARALSVPTALLLQKPRKIRRADALRPVVLREGS